MTKRIFSLLLALCLIVGLLPAVAMPQAHAEEGEALEATYTLKFSHSTYTLSKYDTPIYFVNQAFEEYDAAETQTLRTFYQPSTTGASEDNWNAKLIWHTGDEGPTLYLNGFRFDEYDDDAGTWKGTEGKGATVTTTTGITGAATAPLTIVLTGEDSLIETALIGIYPQNDLTVLSEGDTKLVINGYHSGFYSDISGADLTVNANIDVSAQKEWNTSRTPMSLTNGNITINGGNVNIVSHLARLSPIRINAVEGDTTGGTVTINGGNVTVTGGTNAISVPAGGSVQVNAGSIDIAGGSQNLTVGGSATLPTVPEDACVVVTYRYWASYNPVTVNGMPTSITRAAHIKIVHHANRTEVAAVAPDCVNDGTIQHWTCDACGKNFATADAWAELESIVDPSVGEHAAGEIVKENEVAADCENDGSYDAVTYCTGCDMEMSRTTVDVTHLGHTEVAVEQVDPTTTTVGTTAGTKCSVCGIVLSGCEEIPMLQKASIAIMSWGTMTVTEGGDPVYAKTVSYDGYTSAGVANGTGWKYTTTGASASDWNIKFEYPMGGTPTLTLKDATLDHIGDDNTTLYTLESNGTYKSTGTLSAIICKSGYQHDLKIVLQGKNHIEVNNGIVRGSQGGENHLNNITIVGEDGGSLTGTGKGIGILLHNGYDLTVENANIDIYTTSSGGTPIPFRTVNGDITIIGSNVTISNTKNCAINADTSGNIVITDSVLNLNAVFSNGTTAGAINACTSDNTSGGAITVTNSQITATGNGSIMRAYEDIEINGGNISGDVAFGITSAQGNIKINSGEIEITGNAFNSTTPDLSGYEGWYAVAGASKEAAAAVTDASALASAKYVKISAEPICDHTNTTTSEQTVTEATCTEAGSKTVTVTCECGEVISTETVEIAALGHTEEEIPAVEATCTETGLTAGVKCSVCGETLTAQEEVAPLGHAFDDEFDTDCNNGCGTTQEPATYADAIGTNSDSYGTLTVDGNTVTLNAQGEVTCKPSAGSNVYGWWIGYKVTVPEGIDAANVTFMRPDGSTGILSNALDTATEANFYVTAKGATVNQQTYKFDWNTDGTYDLTVIVDLSGITTAHAYETSVTEPDCTNAGATTYTCPCGETYSEEIAALGHTEEEIPAVEATCTETGLTAGVKCAVCGETLVAQEEVAALGHTEEEIPAVEATCTETGLTAGKKCTVCGETTVAQEEVAALGHTEEEIPAVEATCTETGLTAGVKCAVCGETLTAQEEVAALGHSYDNDFDTECNVCGETRTVEEGLTVTAENKLQLVDTDSTHIYHRVIVYFLGDQTAADITDETALKEIDPDAETYWGTAQIDSKILNETGNYVLVLNYNDTELGGKKETVYKEVSIVVPELAQPEITVDEHKVTVTAGDASYKNFRATVFFLGDQSVDDICDGAALKAIDPDAKTAWGMTEINKIQLLENGNYVIYLEYNLATGAKQVVAKAVTIEHSDVTLDVVNGQVVATDPAKAYIHHRAVVYYLGDETVEDIYDEAALQAIDTTAKTYWRLFNINKINLTEPGNYVVMLHYNLENSVKMTIAVSVTI